MIPKKPMSEAQLKAQRERAKKPRIMVPHGIRQAAMERRANALDTLSGIGLDHITNMIAMGPGSIRYDDNGDATADCMEQFQRFKWACEFIGDRCGMSRRHETAIEGEALPEIVVKFANHPRPADS